MTSSTRLLRSSSLPTHPAPTRNSSPPHRHPPTPIAPATTIPATATHPTTHARSGPLQIIHALRATSCAARIEAAATLGSSTAAGMGAIEELHVQVCDSSSSSGSRMGEGFEPEEFLDLAGIRQAAADASPLLEHQVLDVLPERVPTVTEANAGGQARMDAFLSAPLTRETMSTSPRLSVKAGKQTSAPVVQRFFAEFSGPALVDGEASGAAQGGISDPTPLSSLWEVGVAIGRALGAMAAPSSEPFSRMEQSSQAILATQASASASFNE